LDEWYRMKGRFFDQAGVLQSATEVNSGFRGNHWTKNPRLATAGRWNSLSLIARLPPTFVAATEELELEMES
jgi:hypothetical protein